MTQHNSAFKPDQLSRCHMKGNITMQAYTCGFRWHDGPSLVNATVGELEVDFTPLWIGRNVHSVSYVGDR
jgi:hypothetical protein